MTLPFPTTPVLDNFQRSNENPLSDGGKWGISGGVGATLKLVSHVVQDNGTFNFPTGVWLLDSWSDSETWVSGVQWGAGNEIDLYARTNANDGYGYSISFFSGPGTICNCFRQDPGGVFVQIGGAIDGSALPNGTGVGIRMLGQMIEAWVQRPSEPWTLIGTFGPDATYRAPGHLAVSLDDTASPSTTFTSFGGGAVGALDEINTYDPASLLQNLRAFLVNNGVCRIPRNPSGTPPVPPCWLDPERGIPYPGQTQGLGPNEGTIVNKPRIGGLVLAIVPATGIASPPHEGFLVRLGATIWYRSALSPEIQSMHERIRALLSDQRNYSLNGLAVNESLLTREIQRVTSNEEGYVYNCEYMFLLWGPDNVLAN